MGGPVRTFADASARDMLNSAVAPSSLSVGWRAAAHRPGRTWSTTTCNAARFAWASRTSRKVPNTTADR